MKREELLIFLSFFLIFSTFIQINDAWNFEYSYYQTKNVVDRHKFDLSPFKNRMPPFYWEVGNRTYTDTRFIYSFSTSPLYLFSQSSFELLPNNDLFPERRNYTYRVGKIRLRHVYTPFEAYYGVLVTLGTSVLFGSLSVLLVYKLLKHFTNSKKIQMLVTLGFGAGTPIFAFSTTPNVYIFSLFLIIASFYLLFRSNEKKKPIVYFLLAGVLAGLSYIAHIPSLLFATLLAAFALLISWRGSLLYLLGCLIGTIPFMIYRKVTMEGNLLWAIIELKDLLVGFDSKLGEIRKFIANRVLVWSGIRHPQHVPQVIVRLLFSPYRGLFIYAPLLILSLVGLYFLLKNRKRRKEGVIITVMFACLLLMVALLPAWWGNYSFGPKRLLLIIPFLTMATGYALDKLKKGGRRLFLILLILSLAVNFLGLQVWEGVSGREEVVNSLKEGKPIGNPLLDYYVPLTLKNGPRGALWENLILEGKFDIWTAPGACKQYSIIRRSEVPLGTFHGLLTLKLPFLNLALLSLILLFIWRKKIFHKLQLSKNQQIIALLIIVTLLPLSFLRVRNYSLGPGWYPLQNNRDLSENREMKENGTIYVYSRNKTYKTLKFEVDPFIKQNKIGVYLNQEQIGQVTNAAKKRRTVKVELPLSQGTNEIELRSARGCKTVGYEDCSIRCIGALISNITFSSR